MQLTLTSAGLTLQAGARRETRPLGSVDGARLFGWSERYAGLVSTGSSEGLADLGRELWGWLDGPGHWLAGLSRGSGPRELEFVVEADGGGGLVGLGKHFLDAPWELLATEQGFLAADADRPLVVGRRLGEAQQPVEPAHADLLVMFMAAEPEGQRELDFEREEAGILRATEGLPLHLYVEQSGCLQFLQPRLAREAGVEVVHLSCHGDIKQDEPVLLLEDPFGRASVTRPEELGRALGARKPPLVFLSACRSAEQPATALSLAMRLVRAGVANVVGWDGSVSDQDAADFAREFYRELSSASTVVHAVGVARGELLRAQLRDLQRKRGGHWHLARVYLGEAGGGRICDQDKPLRPLSNDVGAEEFLDEARQVPVAPRQAFVGRRRTVQRLLRVLTERPKRHAGALIHGMGRLGKSSLAARVANRLPQCRPVVVYGDYRAAEVWRRVLGVLPARKQLELGQVWSDAVEQTPAQLKMALKEVLEDVCATHDPARDRQRILLIIDDLEQILEPPRRGQDATTVQSQHHLETLRAVIEAFAEARSESRLLLTSRYRFSLPDARGRDLAPRLLPVPLAAMNEQERTKQLRTLQEIRAPELGGEPRGEDDPETAAARTALLARCVAAGRGNPGLQGQLVAAVFRDPAAAERAVAAVERFHATGAVPAHGEVGEFFKQLKLEVYRDALTPAQRDQLRAGLLCEQAVPHAVLEDAGVAFGVSEPGGAIKRLADLGLLEELVSGAGGAAPLLAVSALARPLVRALSESEVRLAARGALEALAQAWRAEQLPRGAGALEVARVAKLAGSPALQAEAALAGGHWLFRSNDDARSALALADTAMAALEAAGLEPDPHLARLAAECADRLGEVAAQERWLDRGLAAKGGDPLARAMLLLRRAERDRARGQVREAEAAIGEAASVFAGVHDERMLAIARGQHADILQARGELE